MTTMSMPRVAPTPAEAPAKKGRLKWIVAVLLVAVLGGVAWTMVKPAPEVTEPVAGEVLTLEPVQLNLAGGHYLRVGIALQLVEEAHDLDGSQALDATISVLSGKQVADISTAQQREGVRATLLERLDLAYEGDVMGVYFTEFVIQ